MAKDRKVYPSCTYNSTAMVKLRYWLSLYPGLQTIDKSLYEAVAIDGVKNRWQELWFVTLPAMKPQLCLVLLCRSPNPLLWQMSLSTWQVIHR